MNNRKLAEHYLRFWTSQQDLADNAPAELWRFVLGLPSRTDRAVVKSALRHIATNEAPELPSLAELFAWFAKHPEAVAKCDAALASRQPPKNVQTLLRQAYLGEVAEIKAAVQKFLTSEIEKFS